MAMMLSRACGVCVRVPQALVRSPIVLTPIPLISTESIANARHCVQLETYEMAPDAVGHRTIAELTRARQRGCEVSLMYDEFGSAKSFLSSLTQPLVHAGGEVIVFNKIVTWPWRINHPILLRNHRKILVVDDEIGFCGGMNTTCDYVGTRLGGTGMYRDTHVRVQGPAVKHLRRLFNDTLMDIGHVEVVDKSNEPDTDSTHSTPEVTSTEDVEFALQTQDRLSGELDANADIGTGSVVQILESNTLRGKYNIQKALRLALRNSQSHCFITTPYFIPPLRLQRAILRAARNGCDVRILTAGETDVPVARMATQHVLRLFLSNNVRIYEMTSQVLHAKTVTIDGVYGAVGSFNWDIFSGYRNLEVTLTSLDHQFAHDLEQQFREDIRECREVKLSYLERRTVFQKIAHFFAYHMVRMVRYMY